MTDREDEKGWKNNFYPHIEGMSSRQTIEAALVLIPEVAQLHGCAIPVATIERRDLYARLDSMNRHPDRIKETMLAGYCPGHVNLLCHGDDEVRIKLTLMRFNDLFDLHFYRACIVLHHLQNQLSGLAQEELSALDFVKLYNYAIIEALEADIKLFSPSNDRPHDFYYTLSSWDGLKMLQLFGEMVRLIFPEEEFRKACLEADLLFSRARSYLAKDQSEKRAAKLLGIKNRQEALERLHEMMAAALKRKNIETT